MADPTKEHLTDKPTAEKRFGKKEVLESEGGDRVGKQGNTKLVSPKTGNNKELDKSFCLKYFFTYHKVYLNVI